jgi:hypothetical protein
MFFGLFSKKKPEVPEDVFVSNDDPVFDEGEEGIPPEENETSSTARMVLSIDKVFDYFNADYEGRGYLDAVSCPDSGYREITKRRMKDEARVLIKRVSLEYTDQIRKLDSHIVSRSSSGLTDVAKSLQSTREMMQQHIQELSEITRNMENDSKDSLLLSALASYERGFMRGLASNSFAVLKGEER